MYGDYYYFIQLIAMIHSSFFVAVYYQFIRHTVIRLQLDAAGEDWCWKRMFQIEEPKMLLLQCCQSVPDLAETNQTSTRVKVGSVQNNYANCPQSYKQVEIGRIASATCAVLLANFVWVIISMFELWTSQLNQHCFSAVKLEAVACAM